MIIDLLIRSYRHLPPSRDESIREIRVTKTSKGYTVTLEIIRNGVFTIQSRSISELDYVTTYAASEEMQETIVAQLCEQIQARIERA